MSEVKKTAQLAAIYAVGVILEKIASFIMLPIYTRYLSPADYGTIELLQMTIDVFGFVAGAGLAKSIFRFYYRYKDEIQRHTVISTAAMLFIAFYAAASCVGVAMSSLLAQLVLEGRAADVLYFRIMFAVFFLQAFITVPLLFIQAQQRPFLFVAVSLLKLVLQLALNIHFVVFLGLGVLGVLYALVITWAAFGGVLLLYTVKSVGLRFSRIMARELLVYGAPIIVSSLAAFIITFSDRYFIKAFRDLSEVGVYSLGYKFGFILMVVAVQPIFRIWDPKRFEIAERKDAQQINRQVFSLLNLVLVTVALGIALFSRDLLHVMSDREFWGAHAIVPVVLLAYIIQAWTDFGNFGIHYSGKTRYLAISTVVSAAAIIALSFALIPTYGAMGAAWATVIAFVVRLAVVLFYSQREYKLGLDWLRGLAMVALAAALYIVASILAQQVLWLSIALNAIVFAVFAVALLTTPVLSRSDRRVVLGFLRHPLAMWKSR